MTPISTVTRTEKLIRLYSLAVHNEGLTSDPAVYRNAVHRAVELSSDLVVMNRRNDVGMRKLPVLEAELRRLLLSGLLLAEPEPGMVRININLAPIGDVLNTGLRVAGAQDWIEGVVDYVKYPNSPWITCDIQRLAIPGPYQDVGYRGQVRLNVVHPNWIVGVNGLPRSMFEKVVAEAKTSGDSNA